MGSNVAAESGTGLQIGMKVFLPKVVLVGILATGCSTTSQPSETRTVRGVLKYYPSNVKSLQAWYGHNFMVDATPILPSDAVSEEMLRKHTGSLVVVTGVWQPGKEWKPSTDEEHMQMPVNPLKETVTVGYGLRASSIVLVER